MALRSSLFRLGLRYRINRQVLKGSRRRADVVFPGARVVVFVDGCFWHACPIHATWPQTNARWWRLKLEANRQRDRDTDRQLSEAGWEVVRVWEHEDPAIAAGRIAAIIERRREDPR